MIRFVLVSLLAVLAAGLGACSPKIGDSCNTSADCSQDNSRVCDTFSPDGYCTINGCDFGTCPSEAVCVQFFPALENATACLGTDGNPNQDLCLSSEFCTVGGQCAPRSIEQRFCMATCESDGDCRDGYECRTHALQVRHGGQPVADPNATTIVIPDTSFCAGRRNCTSNADCETGERCNPFIGACEPIPT
jgi:hypothetical protein